MVRSEITAGPGDVLHAVQTIQLGLLVLVLSPPPYVKDGHNGCHSGDGSSRHTEADFGGTGHSTGFWCA